MWIIGITLTKTQADTVADRLAIIVGESVVWEIIGTHGVTSFSPLREIGINNQFAARCYTEGYMLAFFQ